MKQCLIALAFSPILYPEMKLLPRFVWGLVRETSNRNSARAPRAYRRSAIALLIPIQVQEFRGLVSFRDGPGRLGIPLTVGLPGLSAERHAQQGHERNSHDPSFHYALRPVRTEKNRRARMKRASNRDQSTLKFFSNGSNPIADAARYP